MRYQTKLMIATGALLFLSLLAAGLSYWGLQKSRYLWERSTFAHLQLEDNLRLSSQTYQLFKQFADVMLIGDLDRGVGRTEVRRKLEESLQRVRESIDKEFQEIRKGDVEAEKIEKERLQEIEKQIAHIIHGFLQVEMLAKRGQLQQARSELTSVLESSIDQKFRHLLQKAIVDEAREVNLADAAVEQLQNQLTKATQIHAGVAIIFTLACVYFLLVQLRKPLSELLDGTRALSAGNLSHRINIPGRDEFALLGHSFNQMAEQLGTYQSRLEELVAERTSKLRQANKRLEEIDKARSQFFAEISHELRTPLTIVMGEGQIALRGKEKSVEDYKVSLERIVEQSEHMSTLVNDLLLIARQGLGEAKFKMADVDIGDLVSRVAENMQVIAEARDITVNVEAPDQKKIISADAGRLRQLILILLDNAVSYSSEGGEVTASVEDTGDRVTIRVQDQGIGIAEEEVGRIFERFHRGGNAMDHHASGVGLGLPVAKAITEAHKGQINVESEVGKGTTISVTLPVNQNRTDKE